MLFCMLKYDLLIKKIGKGHEFDTDIKMVNFHKIILPGVLKKGSLKGALKLFLLENFLN